MKRKMCGRPLLSCLLAVLLCIGAAPAQAAETPASEKSGAVNWVETVDEGILQEPVEIPILMYHNLVAEEDDPSISKNTMWVGQFQHQMELLEENGFTTITVDQLVEFGNRGKALPEKPVLITFDDGYRSAYELAFPILQEMDFHAAMFPIGVSVGKDTYKDTGLAMVPHFSWEEAKEWRSPAWCPSRATPMICTSGRPLKLPAAASACVPTSCASPGRLWASICRPCGRTWSVPARTL